MREFAGQPQLESTKAQLCPELKKRSNFSQWVDKAEMLSQNGSSARSGSSNAPGGGRPIHKDISPRQTIDRVAGDDNQAPVEAVASIGGNRPEEKGN